MRRGELELAFVRTLEEFEHTRGVPVQVGPFAKLAEDERAPERFHVAGVGAESFLKLAQCLGIVAASLGARARRERERALFGARALELRLGRRLFGDRRCRRDTRAERAIADEHVE